MRYFSSVYVEFRAAYILGKMCIMVFSRTLNININNQILMMLVFALSNKMIKVLSGRWKKVYKMQILKVMSSGVINI